jgi:hypothetical protein
MFFYPVYLVNPASIVLPSGANPRIHENHPLNPCNPWLKMNRDAIGAVAIVTDVLRQILLSFPKSQSSVVKKLVK